MMTLDFFQLAPIPENAMKGFYSGNLVFLSYVVATLASLVALQIAGKIRQEKPFLFRLFMGGAFAMGAGIFTMHFIGMLAFHMPIPARYSFSWTLLSLIIAIIASGFAIYLIRNPQTRIGGIRYICGGIVLGLAIVSMHYTGMTAMTGVKITYLPGLFFLSILVAIFASLSALYLMIKCEQGSIVWQKILKIVSALSMGAAICGMHYIGMAAAVITPIETHGLPTSTLLLLSPEKLSFVVAFVASIIMVIALVVATGYMQMILVKILTGFLIAPLLLIPLAVVFFQNIQVSTQWGKVMSNELFPRMHALFKMENDVLKIQVITAHITTGESKDELSLDKNKLLAVLVEMDKWESRYIQHLGEYRNSSSFSIEDLKTLKDKVILSTISLIALIEEGASPKAIADQRDVLDGQQTGLSKFIEKAIFVELSALDRWSNENKTLEDESGDLFLITIGSIFLFSLVTSVFIAIQITEPIIQVKDISRKIAKGDLNTLVQIKSDDEFGEMGKNFNEMINALSILKQKKDLLLRMAAHDLRNPLSVITESTSLLTAELADKIDAEQRSLLDMIGRASHSMLSLLNNLLAVDVVHANIFKIELMRVNVRNYFQHIFEYNELLARKKKINLRLDLQVVSEFAYFDPGKVDQVINNLLSNAFKFSLPGSNVVMVIKEDGKTLRAEIHDEGPGIPVNEQHKVFTPFSKMSIKTTGGEPSHGLGLSLCKDIISAHEGKIGFNSQIGKGSMFYFEIDLRTGV